MSYDLVVWVGERPDDADAADAKYDELMELLESDDGSPANPRLVAYADALLERWPADARVSPWVVEPLISDAVGDVFPFGVQFEHAEVVASYAAGLAIKHGLVCYDPQEGRLRP
ncbi:hypothetical protein [Kribbella amoyensis]|nr:hypothetical protein [Kribbella amoyensis]